VNFKLLDKCIEGINQKRNRCKLARRVEKNSILKFTLGFILKLPDF
jgi:hypothetical protein